MTPHFSLDPETILFHHGVHPAACDSLRRYCPSARSRRLQGRPGPGRGPRDNAKQIKSGTLRARLSSSLHPSFYRMNSECGLGKIRMYQ